MECSDIYRGIFGWFLSTLQRLPSDEDGADYFFDWSVHYISKIGENWDILGSYRCKKQYFYRNLLFPSTESWKVDTKTDGSDNIL